MPGGRNREPTRASSGCRGVGAPRGSLADVAELHGDSKRVAADDAYALTDHREVDRTIALAL
jgi:hypothetical protein